MGTHWESGMIEPRKVTFKKNRPCPDTTLPQKMRWRQSSCRVFATIRAYRLDCPVLRKKACFNDLDRVFFSNYHIRITNILLRGSL